MKHSTMTEKKQDAVPVTIDSDYPSEESIDVIRKLHVPALRKLSTKKLFDLEDLAVNPPTAAELEAAVTGRVPEATPHD